MNELNISGEKRLKSLKKLLKTDGLLCTRCTEPATRLVLTRDPRLMIDLSHISSSCESHIAGRTVLYTPRNPVLNGTRSSQGIWYDG